LRNFAEFGTGAPHDKQHRAGKWMVSESSGGADWFHNGIFD